jgi:hypothetical protein
MVGKPAQIKVKTLDLGVTGALQSLHFTWFKRKHGGPICCLSIPKGANRKIIRLCVVKTNSSRIFKRSGENPLSELYPEMALGYSPPKSRIIDTFR